MAKPGLLSVEDARARLLRAAVQPVARETVALLAAQGRILAADQMSPVHVPPADNSAMDGYAFRLADLAAARADGVPVSQRIPAGTAPLPLQPGTAARIFTGADIPPGADLVVMQEDCVEAGPQVRINTADDYRQGENIRPRGQDIAAGSLVLAAGTRLGPAQLGVLAAAGIATVPVWSRLKVAFFSTGDELLEPGVAPQPGRIYNSNRYALHGYLTALGCEPVDLGVIADQRPATEQALLAAAASADLVITTGGASVGEEDHLQAALRAVGQVDLWKVAIKPGKPLLFGHVPGAGGRRVPVLGLPGNPVAVAVTFLVLGLPLLQAMQGLAVRPRPALRIPAAFAVPRAGSRTEYLRVRLVPGAAGPVLERHPNQSSGVLTSLAWADGFAVVPAGATVAAGEMLDFLPFPALLAAF